MASMHITLMHKNILKVQEAVDSLLQVALLCPRIQYKICRPRGTGVKGLPLNKQRGGKAIKMFAASSPESMLNPSRIDEASHAGDAKSPLCGKKTSRLLLGQL